MLSARGNFAGRRIGVSVRLLVQAVLLVLIAGTGGPLRAADPPSPPAAPKPVLSEEEQAQGWVLLFDGETVNGWKGVNTPAFPYNGWTVEDGYLRTIKPGPSGDIITTGAYRDFELRFSWRLERGGNSGVKYLVKEGRPEPNIPVISWQRIPRLLLYAVGLGLAIYLLIWRQGLTRYLLVRVLAVAVVVVCGYSLIKGARSYVDLIGALRHSAVGLEYQVLDDFDNAEPKSEPKASAGSLYILLEASRDKKLYNDERFNEGRVVVLADHVEHWLNGEKVLDYNLSDPRVAEAVAKTKYAVVPNFLSREGGHIALQHHNDMVWFKDIKLRPLKTGTP
ncbi:MAG: DUF1080 domain-containing protein [Bryobacterales bacterium]|nr:DUF1080 domain-containing protein [Bryobacterales bacterium]